MTEAAAARQKLKKQKRIFLVSTLITIIACAVLFSVASYASPSMSIIMNSDETENSMGMIEIMFMFTLLALFPSILMMMTSFTRIIIVLSFLRNALGTQQSPPNQVLIGLALFLTLFVMKPVFAEIQTVAYEPYKNGTITQKEAVDLAIKPMKVFMIKQMDTDALNLFLTIADSDTPIIEEIKSPEDLTPLGLEILVPAFITSELERAFLMGFLLFLPFLIIDMVVSSVLMSMGMVMLPPAMIALPFKILMFVMVDGWGMLFGTLVRTFQ